MANKGSFLATGQYLSVNDYLVSDNGEFFAVMQSDGNFVLYRGSGPSDNQGYIWSISHTSLPAGQYFAIMQGDGNFVVYHGAARVTTRATSGQSAIPRYRLASTLPSCKAMAISSSTRAATRPIRALRSGPPIPLG